jgi:hypothetical protein
VLALEVDADALLIDERDGRAIALRLGLSPIGALGVLVRARQRGHLGAVGPMMDRLESELGFFIGAELRTRVLEEAGEVG